MDRIAPLRMGVAVGISAGLVVLLVNILLLLVGQELIAEFLDRAIHTRHEGPVIDAQEQLMKFPSTVDIFTSTIGCMFIGWIFGTTSAIIYNALGAMKKNK